MSIKTPKCPAPKWQQEFKSLRQEGIVDLYQKQEAIYEDFTKSVGSVTRGVKKFPQQCFITDVSVSY